MVPLAPTPLVDSPASVLTAGLALIAASILMTALVLRVSMALRASTELEASTAGARQERQVRSMAHGVFLLWGLFSSCASNTGSALHHIVLSDGCSLSPQ
jgi:hypothetical protein